ncbi:retrotransposon protein, putative, ty1-copia subclass [Tanacetum coccineum]
MKKLRTDNSLEFCNQEFNNLCKESRIARHLIVARTPQQNGLAERMNRTLLNKVRCLLIQLGLPDSFWAKATVTAAYLINRSPSTALEKMKPMDLWSRHPANYEMLRIFGCVAYSHVNQGKLKPRAIKCIFLGYPDGVKGYRLWRLYDVKPKIIISRDVVFNESLMYKDTLKGAGAADSGKEVEFEVELQGNRVELTKDPHTRENPGNEDEEQDEENNYRIWTTIPLGLKVDDMEAYAFAIAKEEDTHEPVTFQEAINSSEKDEWVRAIEEEMSSLKKNHTWELVDQPPGQKLLEQLDVKMVFLHGNLEETIYMRQPPGFEKGPGNKSKIEYTKGLLQKEFDMKEPGPARKILGMEIVRDRGNRTLKMSQSRYVQKLLNNYRVDNGKLDIAYVVSIVRKYLANPGKNHREAVKWILKYLKGTADVGLVYGRDQWKHVDVDGFMDADYAKDPDKGRSITDFVFMVHGYVVSWKATLQHVVALSTTEAKYMALTEARTKHINVRYHFIREIVESKEIEVAKLGMKDNAADAFTKVVTGPKFKYYMKILGVGANSMSINSTFWEGYIDPFSRTMTDAEKTTALKTDVYKKAHSALLLCLDNKVLREVNKEDSAAGVWLKLETLYMTKSLANKLYLKKKLFTFYMHSGKKLSEHIDEFKKLIGDLANIDVDIDDEDQALMLLTSLPSSYDNFVETLLYGRESFTLGDVLSSLNSWELKKRTDAKDEVIGSPEERLSKKEQEEINMRCQEEYGTGSGMHSEGYDNGDIVNGSDKEEFFRVDHWTLVALSHDA